MLNENIKMRFNVILSILEVKLNADISDTTIAYRLKNMFDVLGKVKFEKDEFAFYAIDQIQFQNSYAFLKMNENILNASTNETLDSYVEGFSRL